MIVAHVFLEVIVSDLAHEKSELAHLCLGINVVEIKVVEIFVI